MLRKLKFEVEKPAMRQQLIDNLTQVKTDVLYQPESGIISILDRLEIYVENNHNDSKKI